MDRGGQAPRPASDIKHGKMAVVGLAGGFWPISNTPFFFERKGTSVPNFIDREEAKSTTGTPGGGKKRRGGCGLVSNKKGRQTIGPCSNTEGDLGLDLIYH
jgi:hypothetical protein